MGGRCPECTGPLKWNEEVDAEGDVYLEYLECRDCGFTEELS